MNKLEITASNSICKIDEAEQMKMQIRKLKNQLDELLNENEYLTFENRCLTDRLAELECLGDPYSLNGEAVCNSNTFESYRYS